MEYEQYGPKITSDRLIQLSAITIDKNTMDFHKAEKTVVLDEPDIEIQVCSGSGGVHGANLLILLSHNESGKCLYR